MAKTTQNYSANAASNTALIAPDGTQIPLGEGQTLPKHVNDAFRALMADTAIAAKFSGLPAGRSVAVTVKLVSNTDSLGSFPAVGGQKLELDGAVNPALVLAGTTAAPHTYTFDTSDSSMTGALRFYEDASQTTEYTTGVTVSSGQTTIAVTDTAPKVLYYQLAGSAGLGGIAYVLGVTGEQQTAAEIKTAYESNADTNAFTDAEKTKLTGIAAGATAFDGQYSSLTGTPTLGTAAAAATTDFATAAQGATADTAVQPNDSPTFANLTLTGYLAGPATFTIDPAVVGDDTGKVVIAGNLQVDGDTTTVNSTTVEVGDKNIVLGADATADTQNHGAGITVSRPDSTDAGISWDETSDEWGVTNGLNVAGTITADGLNLGDNDAASFGAGNDLQIYHDGNNSFIAENGTGNLRLSANDLLLRSNDAFIQSEDGLTNAARFNSTTGVSLFRAGDLKLATTSTGVDVTGDVAISDGSGTANRLVLGDGTDSKMFHNGVDTYWMNDTGNVFIRNLADDKDVALQTDDGSGGYVDYVRADGSTGEALLYHNGNERLNTTSTGVDVTGTVTADGLTVDTDTLHVDATNNRVGVGTTSPSATLEVNAGGATTIKNLNTLWTGSGTSSYFDTDGIFSFRSANAYERMRIDAAGNVGIGTTSPTQELHVQAGTGLEADIRLSGNAGASSYLDLFHNATAAGVWNASNTSLQFGTNASERMRITNSGNVGIGTTSPATELDVAGTVRAYDLTVADGTRGQLNVHSPSYNIQGGTNYGDMRFNAPRFRFYEDGTDLRLNIDNGDISFYGDTGTTAKFFWDASAERLGIGTTSPATALDVTGTVTADTFSFANWTVTESGGSLYFATGGTNKMKLDASGNLQVVGNVESNATIS